MRILGVPESPRKEGNTVRLLREALEPVVEEGNFETELISLAEKDVKPCDGCRMCRTTEECHIHDDLEAIFNKMTESDGVILATPVYFGSTTPQMKALMDRVGYLAGSKGRTLENKVGGPLVVARMAGQNFTFVQLVYFFSSKT